MAIAIEGRQGKMKRLVLGFGAIVLASVLVLGMAETAAADPTCAGVLGSDIQVHGQHIVGDYVTGLGAVLPGQSGYVLLDEWPPAGQVGEAVQENGGALVPGGPGPGFHFLNGVAPGASFCLEQSNAPGIHF
jgi:hypothetical protein